MVTKKGVLQKIFVGVSAMVMSLMLVGSYNIVTYANELSEEYVVETENDANNIAPHSAIIEYRYKVEGTKLYRRLYNYTEQCWVGDWEYVGEGYVKPDM